MTRTARRMARLTMMVMLVVMASVSWSRTTPEAAAQSSPRTVFVHLFEWKWTDIARECETWLGPKGYAAVQVSPPQEHVQGSQWWTRYQPVSYRIESRGGTRAEFANMVSRCQAVGVEIYADAVINHMSGSDAGGTGVAGSSFQHYVYPGTYAAQDFHYCGRNGGNDIANYGDRWEVQNCELVNLSDLDTGAEYVRGRIATYLNDLRSLGVTGFRIDAAKHMPAGDLSNIIGRLNNAPYIYHEVIDQGGEPISASEYFGSGDVSEFKYSQEIGRVFKVGKLDWLSQFGTAWGFMPSANAIVFTDNHDNQRGHGGGGNVLNFHDGKLYELANIFELAWPYGYPQVMSSFEFANTDQGPPASRVHASSTSTTANCFNEWKCEHRWRGIANMVAFRNYTNSVFSTSNWWSNGNNQISWSRGNLGFVAINREGASLSRTFQTGLPAGTYCDVIHGDWSNNQCTGPTISVDGSGNAAITVAANDAVALYGGARLAAPAPTATPAAQSSVTFNVNASTVTGQNVYIVGNLAALGSWNTGQAVLMSSATYPVWSATLNLPRSTAVEYKYIKKDGAGNVIWESGTNRTFTTPTSGAVTRNETWR